MYMYQKKLENNTAKQASQSFWAQISQLAHYSPSPSCGPKLLLLPLNGADQDPALLVPTPFLSSVCWLLPHPKRRAEPSGGALQGRASQGPATAGRTDGAGRIRCGGGAACGSPSAGGGTALRVCAA